MRSLGSGSIARSNCTIGVYAALFALTISAIASAQPSAQDRAGELYDEAGVAYRDGNFDRAAALLTEAYAIFPEPILLYNLARAHESAGHLAEAADGYERYLHERPDAEDRGAIAARISNLRAQLAARRPIETPRPRDPDLLIPSIWLAAGGTAIVTGTVLALVGFERHEHANADSTSMIDAIAANGLANDLAIAANVAWVTAAALVSVGVTWMLVELLRF